MKKFIFIIVHFILLLLVIGCATMTPEQRKGTYDLSANVGNKPWVGDPNNLDARGLMKAGWW